MQRRSTCPGDASTALGSTIPTQEQLRLRDQMPSQFLLGRANSAKSRAPGLLPVHRPHPRCAHRGASGQCRLGAVCRRRVRSSPLQSASVPALSCISLILLGVVPRCQRRDALADTDRVHEHGRIDRIRVWSPAARSPGVRARAGVQACPCQSHLLHSQLGLTRVGQYVDRTRSNSRDKQGLEPRVRLRPIL